MRVPWTARRSNQSILKISPGCSLEGLMLKLKLQTLATSWEEFGKDPDAGKNWGQKEKGTTEDEMVGWHHQLNGHGFGYPPGVDDGQGGLVCCGSWGHKESDTTKWLNWIELIYSVCVYIYTHTYIHTYIYTYMHHIYIYVYIYIYIHTHTHTHIYMIFKNVIFNLKVFTKVY